MKVVMQSFGNEREYKRAIFAIYTFYANAIESTSKKAETVLFTDKPDYFLPYFESLPVRYVLLTDEKLKNMRGEIDFLHRIKIACIEEVLQEDSVFYVDSDTFFITDPARQVEDVSPEVAFMHLREYSFKTLKDQPLPAGKTFQAFYNLIVSKSFALKNATVVVSPEKFSWNAGVIVLHKDHKVLLEQVYELTEHFYTSTLNHASEQYAFSIVLQDNAILRPCDDSVYHYWYAVKKQIADRFLGRAITTTWVKKDIAERMREARLFAKKLPVMFDRDYLMLQDNAIQAFNSDQFSSGLKWAVWATGNRPFDFRFWRHVIYHIRRKINSR